MDQAIIQGLRNDLPAVVPSQQRAKEFCVILDLSGIQPEYVAQQKVPRRVLAQWLGLEKLLRRRHRVEVATIQFRKHMRREGREQLRQTERKQTAIAFGLFKEVKRKATDVRTRRPQNDNEIGVLAVVPNLPKTPLIGIAESDVILERDNLESALTNAVDNALLSQQLVGIGDDGEACDPGDVGRELRQDRISPCAGRGSRRSCALPIGATRAIKTAARSGRAVSRAASSRVQACSSSAKIRSR